MEKLSRTADLTIFYVPASSFPAGVKEAFEKLHAMLPSVKGRKFYGISYPDGKGGILYKAGTEELHAGEGRQYACNTFTIKKGTYININLLNFMDDVQQVGKAFSTLLTDPAIDPNGCCVEEYFNDKDVRCMVRLRD